MTAKSGKTSKPQKATSPKKAGASKSTTTKKASAPKKARSPPAKAAKKTSAARQAISPKGKISQKTSSLLGRIFLAEMWVISQNLATECWTNVLQKNLQALAQKGHDVLD